MNKQDIKRIQPGQSLHGWKTNEIFYADHDTDEQNRLMFVATFYRQNWSGQRAAIMETTESGIAGSRVYWRGSIEITKPERIIKNGRITTRRAPSPERAGVTREWRARKLAAGLCGRCGRAPQRPEMKTCGICQGRDAKRMRDRRRAAK